MIDRSTIAKAIRERKQVHAYYQRKRRELCPHVLGTRHDGSAWCLFYQFAGETSSGLIGPRNPPGWKCMNLNDLSMVELKDGPWHTERPKGGKYQSCMDRVELEVQREASWW
jgi:hypothetical protein